MPVRDWGRWMPQTEVRQSVHRHPGLFPSRRRRARLSAARCDCRARRAGARRVFATVARTGCQAVLSLSAVARQRVPRFATLRKELVQVLAGTGLPNPSRREPLSRQKSWKGKVPTRVSRVPDLTPLASWKPLKRCVVLPSLDEFPNSLACRSTPEAVDWEHAGRFQHPATSLRAQVLPECPQHPRAFATPVFDESAGLSVRFCHTNPPTKLTPSLRHRRSAIAPVAERMSESIEESSQSPSRYPVIRLQGALLE